VEVLLLEPIPQKPPPESEIDSDMSKSEFRHTYYTKFVQNKDGYCEVPFSKEVGVIRKLPRI